MTFGEYACAYPQLDQHQRDTGLHGVKNFWNQVLDFNWHKQDKSPNWDALPSLEEGHEKIVIG